MYNIHIHCGVVRDGEGRKKEAKKKKMDKIEISAFGLLNFEKSQRNSQSELNNRVSVSILYLFAFFHGAPHIKYLYLRSTIVLFDSVSSLLYIHIHVSLVQSLHVGSISHAVLDDFGHTVEMVMSGQFYLAVVSWYTFSQLIHVDLLALWEIQS